MNQMHKAVAKGILIFPILKDLNKADGILVKNEGIRKGFSQNGVDVDVLEFTSAGVFNGEEQLYTFHANRYRRIYQYNFNVWGAIANYIKVKSYGFLWFRVPLITPAIAQFVQEVKRTTKCQVILEYGAYPFADELTSFKRMLYHLNRKQEVRMHHLSDFVITYCGQDKVDNLINIPINNGIDLENIPMVRNQPDPAQKINFISVSSLKKWHAYERFLLGLVSYVKKAGAAKVCFHIVGNGPEYEKLAEIVSRENLEDFVIFHHFKMGKELDEIYNQCHVAIGTLGFHRIGITNSSSLKNREYFARGLPVVLSTQDKDMPAELPYVRYVPEGEDPINIEDVVSFAREVYNNSNLSGTIRKYAEEHISWKAKIKEVLTCLNASSPRLSRPIQDKTYL